MGYSDAGFTLTETIVAITIFVLLVVAIFSAQALSHRAYQEGETAAELMQNGRVILERATREIRQAREMVTVLDKEEARAINTIMFEDGRGPGRYRYVRYFQEGNLVKREIIGFYFSGDPVKTLVPWNARPPAGQILKSRILEGPQTIGEYVANLKFWGPRIINIALTMEKRNKILELRTKVFGRNL